MLILGIESSCDETSIALLKDGKEVLANLVSSQIDIHAKYGGVVPEIASRQHILNINPLLDEVFSTNNITPNDIDAIAVTHAPGLLGSLMIGLMTAKTLAWLWDKPLVGINHLEGHIYASFIENDVEFPVLALLVSGGHTELIILEGHGKYTLVGKTKDDAVGEAFDKVARLLDLPYPGGPEIDKLTKLGDVKRFNFPRPLKAGLDFSYSGIKTSVLYKVRDLKESNQEVPINDIAASFNYAIADSLIDKTMRAAKTYGIKRIIVTGGVAANSLLREKMTEACQKNGFDIYIPSMKYCTDNAAMIACAGYYRYINKTFEDGLKLEAMPSLELH